MIDETILSDGGPWASLSRKKIFHKNDDVCKNQYFNWLTRKVLIQCKKIPTTLRMGIVDSVIYYYRNRQWNFFWVWNLIFVQWDRTNCYWLPIIGLTLCYQLHINVLSIKLIPKYVSGNSGHVSCTIDGSRQYSSNFSWFQGYQ